MTEVKKVSGIKSWWKTAVTGVVCAVVGAGAMVGADLTKVSEMLTEAQAKQVAIQAAQYSAEQVIGKITVISTSANKAEVVKAALQETEQELPTIIEGVKAAKEVAEKSVEEVKAVTGTTEKCAETTTTTETTTVVAVTETKTTTEPKATEKKEAVATTTATK